MTLYYSIPPLWLSQVEDDNLLKRLTILNMPTFFQPYECKAAQGLKQKKILPGNHALAGSFNSAQPLAALAYIHTRLLCRSKL